MEKKSDLGVALFLLTCIGTLFFPYYLPLFGALSRFISYPLMLAYLGLTTLFLFRKRTALITSQLFFNVLFLLYPYIRWQSEVVPYDFPGILYALPVVTYLVLVVGVRRFRTSLSWLRRGSIDGVDLILIAGVVVLSAVGLIVWVLGSEPDLERFMTEIPEYPTLVLVFGGLVFALSNAFVEELIFRAVLWEALIESFSKVWITLAVQASMFGLWHWKGFPGGPAGMALVFIWGISLGLIRHRSNGMLGPYICHVCADLTIFGILFAMVRG